MIISKEKLKRDYKKGTFFLDILLLININVNII